MVPPRRRSGRAARSAYIFLRDYASVPCIIKNAIPSRVGDGAVAPLTLTLDDIIDRVGENVELTVDVTPDGHGDCIRNVQSEDDVLDARSSTRRMFVKPHEETMGIGRFRDMLRMKTLDDGLIGCNGAQVDRGGLKQYPLRISPEAHPQNAESCLDDLDSPPVVYYSRQNDCLRTEMSQLFATGIFPQTFSFAEQAFGTGPPDACNLWIGNERSVSSMHKDHYENLFYVCSGKKEFILCPPSDVIFLHEGEFSSGTFRPLRDGGEATSSSWTVVADGVDERTKWIEQDIAKHMRNADCRSEFPLLSYAHPKKVLVSAGQMLYIPSLWYHRVTQTCETVAVNYWFDMRFDGPQWCYFNFLQSLKAKRKESADHEQAAYA